MVIYLDLVSQLKKCISFDFSEAGTADTAEAILSYPCVFKMCSCIFQTALQEGQEVTEYHQYAKQFGF